MANASGAREPARSDTHRLLHPDLQPKCQLHPVARLKTLGRQARLHSSAQIDQIAASIARMGFLVPILVSDVGGELRVVAGIGRLQAAKKLGMKNVPCMVINHLNEGELRAFVLADNRLAELSDWDPSVRALELQELQSLDLDFDLEITGWNEIEIDVMVSSVGRREPEPAPDDPEPAAVVTRIGDVWQLGQHRVACGDATKPSLYEALMADDHASAFWCDPPFNVPIRNHVTRRRKHPEFVMASGEMTPVEYLAFLVALLTSAASWLEDGALVYVCIDWRHIQAILQAGEMVGLTLMNICIWNKKAAGMGSFYRSKHEMVPVFRKGAASHNNRVQSGSNGRNRSNVWDYEGVAGGSKVARLAHEEHSTPKPVLLVEDAILDCTDRGAIVLDPCGGGGSTLIAAEMSGRRARLADLDPGYVDVMVRRWMRFTGREAVLEESGRPFRQVEEDRLLPTPTASPPVRMRTRPTLREV